MKAVSSTPDVNATHVTIEQLVRYAAAALEGCGLEYPHSRMSRIIRREFRSGGPGHVKSLIDRFVGRQLYVAGWVGFERYAATGYLDEVGGRAAANLDAEDAATVIASRYVARREVHG